MKFERFKELWLQRLPMPATVDDATPRANAELAKLADGQPNAFDRTSRMKMSFSWCKVFGLGLALERRFVCKENDWLLHRPTLCGKLFLGPVLVNFFIPLSHWKLNRV